MVYGYNSLENGIEGVELKPQSGSEYVEFETGSYSYYFISFYNTGKFDIELHQVYEV